MKTTALFVIPALLFPALALGQLRNTRHDLSISSTTGGPKADVVNEICIFCHTPHRAQSTQMLWNHAPTKIAVWNWDGDLDGNPMTATTQGTPLPTTLRSASKRCLVCHDGSVALGAVSNLGGGQPGIIAVGDPMSAAKMVGVGGAMKGHHPVSIPYAGQLGYNGRDSHVPLGQVDNAIGNYWRATSNGCDPSTVYCTEASGKDLLDGTRIALVPQAPGAPNVGIECTTCHEVHNRYNISWFLRVKNSTASSLCRSCHNT